ncbi:nucleopolyhedrovirus P10 family protein [Streptomyces verrucosisporus]|uniref:nucleopolyhedrovirus P10 family protein n=1 Tax=Streptomyces verrucosisporus TaxID=1695161 RepID=UPI0019D2EB9C|nr:nucleopolyhedrovirus P10 family protein [Streptomyces verrucosisporus]MBN3928549.1 nucleopolyhedrovirus P10 family protein [Streptomyces verrucosisporus]
MATDRLAQAVRRQIGFGRLLPLGGAEDGAWIAERAAAGVLRQAAAGLPGVRPGTLRLSPAEPGAGGRPAVPMPPSALPPGPVRISAEFEADAREPLPVAAERLRSTLAEAADRRLGLVVAAVDLQITGLLDGPDDGPRPEEPSGELNGAGETTDTGEAGTPVGAAALAVAGVTRLAPELGGAARALRIVDTGPGDGAGAAPGRHVRVQFAAAADHRALDVARAVRAAAARAAAAGAPGPVTVAAVVTEVVRGPG